MYDRIPEELKKKRGPKGPSKYTSEFIEDLRLKLEEWIKDPSHWWITQFAIDQDMWEKHIYDFANENDIHFSEKFRESLKKAEQIQKSRLVQLALAKKIDIAMAIFALKNVAGWRDRSELQHSGKVEGGNNIIIVYPSKDVKKPDEEVMPNSQRDKVLLNL